MDLTRKKIILVDDFNFFLLAAKSRLEKDYDIYTARSDTALYSILEKVYPDLILLDISMPDKNGFEIIKELKESKLYSKIPVVILTCKDDQDSMVKAMELGAADYLVKPVTEKMISENIESFLNPSPENEEKPVILAVDDNPNALQMINKILGKKYTVKTLAAPEGLKRFLSNFKAVLILLDYKMPNLSGFECISLIRDSADHMETPIIMLTSEGSINHIKKAKSLGVCDYIKKPVDSETLLEKVDLHMKSYQIQKLIKAKMNIENGQ